MTGGPILLPSGQLLDRGRGRPDPEPTPAGVDPIFWAGFKAQLGRLAAEAHVDEAQRDRDLRRLALDALDPQLADVVALAEQPLNLDAVEQALRDPKVEAQLAAEVEKHLRDLAALKLGRRYTVRPGARRVFKGGVEIPGGFQAHRRLRGQARQLPRRYRVNVDRREVLTASGKLVPNGYAEHLRQLHRGWGRSAASRITADIRSDGKIVILVSPTPHGVYPMLSITRAVCSTSGVCYLVVGRS